MKKYILVAWLCCLTYTLQAQTNCKIDFNLVNYPDSILYIKGNYGEQILNIDTLHKDKDNSFHLRKPLYKGIYKAGNEKADFFSFVVSEDTDFALTMYPSGYGEALRSPENNLFIQFQYAVNMGSVREYQIKKAIRETTDETTQTRLFRSLDSLNKAMVGYEFEFFKKHPDHISTKIMLSLQDPKIPIEFLDPTGKQLDTNKAYDYFLYMRDHYWDNIPLENDFWLRTPYFYPKFKAYINELAVSNADSVYANLKHFLNICLQRGASAAYRYAIEYYLDYLFPRPLSFDEIMYVHLVDDFINADKVEWMPISEIQKHKTHADEVRKRLPGQPARDLVLKDIDGKAHSLLKTNHRYVLLLVWSHGCSHCVKEFPSLLEFYNKNSKELDMEIFAVEIGVDHAQWKSYVRENPMPWINVYAPHPLSQYGYPMSQTPDFYLINHKGEIVSHTILYPHLFQIMEGLIKSHR